MVGPLLRLLLAGCYGYFLAPSLIVIHNVKERFLPPVFQAPAPKLIYKRINFVTQVFAVKAQGVQIHQKGNTVWSEIFQGIFWKLQQEKRSSQILLPWNNSKKIKLCLLWERIYGFLSLWDFVQIIDCFVIISPRK